MLTLEKINILQYALQQMDIAQNIYITRRTKYCYGLQRYFEILNFICTIHNKYHDKCYMGTIEILGIYIIHAPYMHQLFTT